MSAHGAESAQSPESARSRWRRRPGSFVLVGVLLVAALGASLGAGYVVAHPLLRSGHVGVAKGTTVAQLNTQSGSLEAEANALASGGQGLQVVTLHDGRVAVVNTATHTVTVLDDRDWGGPPAATVASTGPVTVVPGADRGYVVDSKGGSVQPIGGSGAGAAPPVPVPHATTDAVPDTGAGVLVRTSDGKVVRVVGSQATPLAAPPIDRLTTADSHPYGLTGERQLVDLSAAPPRVVADNLPIGPAGKLLLPTARGAGRYVSIVDSSTNRALVVVDPRSGQQRHYREPALVGPLDEPVQLGDTLYVPLFAPAAHGLLPIDMRTGLAGALIRVPGRDSTFSVEVHEDQVVANDQHDRRTLLIDANGQHVIADKGPGTGLTDTSQPQRPRPTPTTSQPDQPDQPDRTGRPEQPRQPTGGGPPRPAPTVPRPTPPPPVVVPVIPAGTDLDEACRRIEAANLTCVRVSAGQGGPTNTVIDTNPPGGSTVEQGHRVRVRYYGQVQVPDVLRQKVTDACQQVTDVVNADFTCAQQPAAGPGTLDTLGLVTAQDPAGNTPADTGTTVSVTYYNTAPMPDYHGVDAAAACADISQRTQNQVTCVVGQGRSIAATGQAVGSVDTQVPAANTPLVLGQSTVSLAAVVDSPRVPPLVGLTPEQANQALAGAGFSANAVPDQLARGRTVTAQDIAPGTPQDGGAVTYHYMPYDPVAANLYTNGDDVWVLRLATAGAPGGYSFAGTIGYAYDSTASGVPSPTGTGVVYGYQCLTGSANCDGHSPNHYYSRQTGPKSGWTTGGPVLLLFNPTAGPGCPAPGMALLYRNWYDSGSTRTYRLEGAPGGVGNELLGCIWGP